MKRRTLFSKLLSAMLLIALVPLLVSSLILFVNIKSTREKLVSTISSSADLEASRNLEMRARQVAQNVANFLKECESDVLLLASLPPTDEVVSSFYHRHSLDVWKRAGSPQSPRDVHEWVPRYVSVQILDAAGGQIAAVRDGRIASNKGPGSLGHAGTDYPGEDFVTRAGRLKEGQIYVSHVTGYHLSKEEQLQGAKEVENAFSGRDYRGVVRFATPIFRNGSLVGIAVLSLDHRHLMEFTQHIQPGTEEPILFPSYRSGNYAFMFDDEGWIITHPKFWDIRGLDPATGRLVPPYTASSSIADVESGKIPFNLDHAAFVHENYPVVSREVREHKSGYVDITNVGGAKKIMAYAPILYETGDYARHGVFGGVTIGFQVDQFHEQARTGANVISRQLEDHLAESGLIVALTVLLVLGSAWTVSRSITRPLALLTEGARMIASGETGNRVVIESSDEIEELAHDFNQMADELEIRKNSLLSTLEELRRSRMVILEERNFQESILESISSAILTLSPDGVLTSINATGRRFFGDNVKPGTHYTQIFSAWGDMAGRTRLVLSGQRQYGREPLVVGEGADTRHFEIGFFPIRNDASRGITVTLRDETEKQRMREEMLRMDRLASLGRLSAGIAHEVRNPLTGISLLLDDLHDRADLEGDSQKMIIKALSEIERVERLIASLLSYASPPRAAIRTGNINLVVQDTLLLFRKECEKRGVTLTSTFHDMPPLPFDPEKIRQALLNVIKNALEAVPPGGTITVATSHDETNRAVITVTDNGSGIAAEDLPFLFEPFFTRKGAGTGLGLSITQRIIEEEHGGSILVESEEGVGTKFVLSIPLAQTSDL